MKEFALIFGKEAAPKLRSGSYADGIAGQGVRLPLAVVGPHVNLPSSDHSKVASDANRFASCFLALCAKALSEAKIELDCNHNKSKNNNCKLESWERLVKSTSSALSQNKRSICLSVGRRSINISLESAPIHTDYNPSAKIRHISESAKHFEYALSQNKRSICLSVDRRSLIISFGERPKLQKLNSATKIPISSGIASPVVRGEICTANPAFPVPNPLSRPFGSANSHFPYRIDPLFCTGGAFGGLRYRKHSLFCTGGAFDGLWYRKYPLFCTGGAFDGLWYRKHPSGCTRPVSNPVPCEKPAHFCTRGGGSARSGLNDWRWTAQNRVQREETDCAKQGSTTGGGLRGAVCSKIISMYTLK